MVKAKSLLYCKFAFVIKYHKHFVQAPKSTGDAAGCLKRQDNQLDPTGS